MGTLQSVKKSENATAKGKAPLALQKTQDVLQPARMYAVGNARTLSSSSCGPREENQFESGGRLHRMAHLQQAFGNQAMLTRIQSGLDPGSIHNLYQFQPILGNYNAALRLQAKLTVNAPGDHYEQEADRVAEQVMRTSAPRHATPAVSSASGSVQRKCSCGGTCPKCEGEKLDHEHKFLQMKSAAPNGPAGIPAPPIVHQILRSPGQPLDPATRAFMEPRFGRDFSQIRVHTDAEAARSARAVQAQAYAVGHDIVFDAGQFVPKAQAGRRLLAHELAHTVQQERGGSSPPLAGGVLEQAAESAAAAIVAGAGSIHVAGASAPRLARQSLSNLRLTAGVQPRSLRGSLYTEAMDEAQLEQEIKLIQEWLKNNPDDPQASYLHSELERSHIALREKERLRQVRAHQSHAAPTIHFGQLSDKDLRAAYIRSTREREILRMSFSYRMSTVLNALRKAKQDPSIAESEWPSKWSIEESADVWNYGISKDLFIPSEKPAVYISMDILATMTYPQRFHDAYHGALADKASSGYPEVKVDPASGLSDDEIWSYGCRKGLFLISEHERIHHDRRPYDGKFEEQEEEEIKSTRRKFESEQYQNWVAQGEQLRSPAPFIQGAAFGAFGWPVAATYGAIQTGATGAELYEACVKGEGDCSTAVVQMGTVVATHYTMRGRPGDVTGGEPAAPPPEPQNPTVLPGTPPVVRAEPLTTSAPKPLVQEPPPVPMQAGPAKPSAPAPSATTAPGTALTKSSGPDPAGTTASTALRSLDDRIRDAEAQLGPKRQSVIEYKAKREAAGEKQKGGPYKGIWNVKEEIWVLKRQKAFPNRQILKQAYIKGVKGSEGTVRATEDIAGAGRILDYVEIEGNQVAGGDLKSAAELMQSIEGGVKKPTSIEGRFRPKSKIGGQRIIEAKVLETARTTGGKLVITGTDVRTGNQVTIEVEPARYQSNVIPYESVYPD